MKRCAAFVFALLCVLLGLVACTQDPQGLEQIEIPETVEKVSVSFYSVGQETEWELEESKLPAWREWAVNLSLQPLPEGKIEELQNTDGGKAYDFVINDGVLSFTLLDHGTEMYCVLEGVYYRVRNGTIPTVLDRS